MSISSKNYFQLKLTKQGLSKYNCHCYPVTDDKKILDCEIIQQRKMFVLKHEGKHTSIMILTELYLIIQHTN